MLYRVVLKYVKSETLCWNFILNP